MMMVKADKSYEAGAAPHEELVAAIGQLANDMIKAGVLLDTAGLLPTSAGARIRVAGGRLTVTDGPFAETKELIGGYAILRAASKEEAIQHGRHFMNLHAEILGPSYEGELEIRQLAEGPV
jgi:hypothetical protein